MIKRGLVILMVLAFALSIAAVALARGAPTKQKAFTSTTAVEMASPTVATVPAMTGHDVIENITTEQYDSIAQNVDVTSTATRRLSPTRYWRSDYPSSRQSEPPNPTCRSGTNAQKR